jgi:hypothetical protein
MKALMRVLIVGMLFVTGCGTMSSYHQYRSKSVVAADTSRLTPVDDEAEQERRRQELREERAERRRTARQWRQMFLLMNPPGVYGSSSRGGSGGRDRDHGCGTGHGVCY